MRVHVCEGSQEGEASSGLGQLKQMGEIELSSAVRGRSSVWGTSRNILQSWIPDSIQGIVVLTRPLSHVKNVALVLLAYNLSSASNVGTAVAAVSSLSFTWSALYVYNAVMDEAHDALNENKRHYASAVKTCGIRATAGLIGSLLSAGLLVGLSINWRFVGMLVLMCTVAYLYSSKTFDFKNRSIVDVLCGASLTFPLRFLASWSAFSTSPPPLVVLVGLAFVKSGGYMLYKGFDRDVMIKLGSHSTITGLSRMRGMAIAGACFFMAFASLAIFMDSKPRLLNPSFVYLLILTLSVPPAIVVAASAIGGARWPLRMLRFAGLVYECIIVCVICLWWRFSA